MKKWISLSLLLVCLFVTPIFGQEPYKLPPQEVIDILDAPPFPRAAMSPSGEMLALVDYETMPPISCLAQPILRLAGLRILPGNNSRQMMKGDKVVSLAKVREG